MINITINVNELNLILGGLAELPAKHSFDIINKLREQAQLEIERLKQVIE